MAYGKNKTANRNEESKENGDVSTSKEEKYLLKESENKDIQEVCADFKLLLKIISGGIKW